MWLRQRRGLGKRGGARCQQVHAAIQQQAGMVADREGIIEERMVRWEEKKKNGQGHSEVCKARQAQVSCA